MNAEVATDSALTVLNRHIAHMAESAIQSAAAVAATSSGTNHQKSVEECWAQQGQQLMSLWRPIVCRNSQMFPPASSRDHHPSSASYVNSGDHSSNLVNHKVNKSSASSESSLSNSKSIPVHCVVMNTTTPCYLSDAVMSSSNAAATPGGNSTKGGVIDGQGSTTPNNNNKASSSSAPGVVDEVDVDSYAIIPASTLFTQIVPVALRKLGYSDDIIFNANGWLTMKNWKPLPLNQIACSDRETVGGILGELTTVATLKIYIRKNQSSNSTQTEMKNKVLRWLMAQSHHVLSSARFPLDEKWQQKVMRGERPNTPSPDTVRQFDTWFQQEMCRPTQPPQQQHLTSSHRIEKVISHRVSPSDPSATPSASILPLSDGSTREASAPLPPRVRMRTTFDPEQELPRLQRWFSENQHPTRFQLQLFVQELNELDSRRGRKPLDVSNLVYWFKNARAAYKRAEVRNNNQNESNNVDGGWMMGGQSMQGCPGEESSDDNRRLDDDEVGVEEEEDDDDSSISAHSNRSYPPSKPVPLKMEPLDLNRSSVEHGSSPKDPQDEERPVDPILNTTADDEDDMDDASQQSDSDSELEDYAENLSVSKSNADHVDKSSEGKSLHLPSSSQSDYTGGGAYPGFPLSLSHAQLNPHGLVYMTSPYLQGIGSSLLQQHHSGSAHHHHHSLHPGSHHHRMDPLTSGGGGGSGSSSCDDRRKRNRTFIDPVTEVPRLEHWFSLNTHPSHSLVLRYTEELNRQPYRLKFPKLEPKNVQFWFKNRRAKCKRLKLSL